MSGSMSGGLISIPAENESGTVLGATLSITILATLIFGTRAYVRAFMIHSFGWDDMLMATAMAISVAGQCVIIPEIYYGAGKHLGDIPPENIPTGMKLNFITQPIYLINICVVKLAVGAALYRIASSKLYKYSIIGVMAFMSFYTIACVFTVFLQCSDIRVQWDSTVQATCWTAETLKALSYTNVALNILTDLLFAIVIPAPMLWNLNVNARTRYTLMGILGLGVFACAAAIIKVGYLVEYGKQGDWLWDSRNITIWTVVENNVGIIAGSLPCLRPLLKGTFLSSSYGKGTHKSPRTGTDYKGTSKGSSWQTTSGKWKATKIPDESSSERAFNATGREDFEMSDRQSRFSPSIQKGTFLAEIEAKSSEESLDRSEDMHTGDGIRKTTRVDMRFSQV
ncbi:hypothetical protein GQ53DRAFT_726509 [Thozetella sp. PMI_491]|nr:hypothetical protein GQ53DRAFT_726509 [Thozetella sp. PMI_491]